MDKQMSNFGFWLMSVEFKLRDFFGTRKGILKEVGIKPGFQVLDYGCGPGSYVPAAAELAGKTGKIYALDAHSLAIKMVQGSFPESILQMSKPSFRIARLVCLIIVWMQSCCMTPFTT